MRIYKFEKKIRYTAASDFDNTAIVERGNERYNCESYAIWNTKEKWEWSGHNRTLEDILKFLSLKPIRFSEVIYGDIVVFLDHCGNVAHYGLVKEKKVRVVNTIIQSKWGKSAMVKAPIGHHTVYGKKVLFARKIRLTNFKKFGILNFET